MTLELKVNTSPFGIAGGQICFGDRARQDVRHAAAAVGGPAHGPRPRDQGRGHQAGDRGGQGRAEEAGGDEEEGGEAAEAHHGPLHLLVLGQRRDAVAHRVEGEAAQDTDEAEDRRAAVTQLAGVGGPTAAAALGAGSARGATQARGVPVLLSLGSGSNQTSFLS